MPKYKMKKITIVKRDTEKTTRDKNGAVDFMPMGLSEYRKTARLRKKTGVAKTDENN